MYGRWRAWVRRHSVVVDALVIAPVVLLTLQWVSQPGPAITVWESAAITATLFTPLFWRRRHPQVVFAITALVSFAQWVGGYDANPANIAVLIAMFSVAARCELRWAVGAGVIAQVGAALAFFLPAGSANVLIERGQYGEVVKAYGALAMLIFAVWIAGIYVNMRRRFLESLVDRAEQAERERDQQAVIAAAEERARIARELHDVIAHNVSVIVVHADGAQYALDSNPDQARQALQTISATGRKALTEMRQLVGVLRSGADAGEPSTPQPGLAQLDELVKQAGTSGLPTRLSIYGTPRDLPQGKQLVIYRIVQEALTNALKHGGPGTRATVEVGFDSDEVKLKIADNGQGVPTFQIKGGHGLVGMRERAAMYGGLVRAAPRIGGGFHVLARIPFGRDE